VIVLNKVEETIKAEIDKRFEEVEEIVAEYEASLITLESFIIENQLEEQFNRFVASLDQEHEEEAARISWIRELVNKLQTGELTAEEGEELIKKAIDVTSEREESIQELKEGIEVRENAIVVYQCYITSKKLNDEFSDFYDRFLAAMHEEDQEETSETEATAEENIVQQSKNQ
jgi:hypothetical protein